MLLETLDVRKNDVLIFSQNKFDFEDNFKIVFKRESNKRPRNITYFEVCEFVKEATPKNIILYRLLTNVESLDAYSTKYGYFINIQGKMELIYFDPIYAIKDLRHLRFNIEPEKFRFKIQQLGISYDTVRDSEPIYKEVFHFDLTASESQHQNDKIFADAIFIFDDSYHIEKPVQKEEMDFESGTAATEEPRKFTMEINEGDVVEDEATVEKNLSKVNFSARKDSNSERDMKIEMLKVALGIKAKTENLENFRKSRTEPEEGIKDYGETSLLDLFKSTSKTNLLSNREKDNIILKLKDSSEE